MSRLLSKLQQIWREAAPWRVIRAFLLLMMPVYPAYFSYSSLDLAVRGRLDLMVLLPLAALLFWSWIRSLRHKRNLDNLPTQRIASAAQGYGEFYGTAEPIEGKLLLSPLFHVPCVWYRYEEIRHQGRSAHVELEVSSKAEFLLKDGSGECLIVPEGAEVTGFVKETNASFGRLVLGFLFSARTCQEQCITPGEPITVVGHLQPARDNMPANSPQSGGQIIGAMDGQEPFLIHAGRPESTAEYVEWRVVLEMAGFAALALWLLTGLW